MKYFIAIIAIGLSSSTFGLAYEGPSPLTGIQINVSTTKSTSGVYQYNYKVTNPSGNDGDILAIRIFIPTDPTKDTTLPATGFTYCKHYSRHSSERAFGARPMVPVGSSTPGGWSCGYGQIHGYTDGAFSWAGVDDPYVIKPGAALGGFTLSSFGLPGLRDVVVQPDIDHERRPADYAKDPNLLPALENKVKWTGQTIGPKAPPKVFSSGDFIAYLIKLVNQSRSLGWIDNDGIANSLLAKLNNAASKVASDSKAAKNMLGAFLSDVQAQNGKHLSSEAYALLYFNGQYAVNHM